MTEFELMIELTETDTRKANEDSLQIALAKEIDASGEPTLIWISFSPFEANTVTWNDVYGVFGSPDPVQQNGVITASSTQLLAKTGTIYPFENGVFGPPEGTGPEHQYAVLNRDPQTLTFGLAQSVAGNGKNLVGSPVNAVALPQKMVAVFEPNETVFVFLFRETETGTVTIVTRSEALKVSFSATNPRQTIHYDEDQKSFVPGPLS